jgi:hypothetical protein
MVKFILQIIDNQFIASKNSESEILNLKFLQAHSGANEK